MLHCGLLGRVLGHSYSPAIHAELADYEYRLLPREPQDLESFLLRGSFDGVNVTIPYKKTVIPYCSELSPLAAEIGSVNTLVRRPDGSLKGYNTDAFGFEYLLRHAGIEAAGKKALVFGSGGASAAVCAVLGHLGAEVTVISRSGSDNYGNLSRHYDGQIIVNTTPVGMYPGNGSACVELKNFSKCEGVLDVVYNPCRTALLMEAEALKLPNAGGLLMLVAQAKRSSELFSGLEIADSEITRIWRKLSLEMQNIVIIGMPGSGKSSVSARLAAGLGRTLAEADLLVEQREGKTVAEIFACGGEAAFRDAERRVLSELGKASGTVISTGGGCVLHEENYSALHQNGIIIRLYRDIGKLARDRRPLSLSEDLTAMAQRREPFYSRFADYTVDNNGSIEECTEQILALYRKLRDGDI